MRIVIWDGDWADEFNMFGFEMITEKEYKQLVDALIAAINDGNDSSQEYYFGTNEFMMYTYSEILDNLNDSRKLSLDEYEVILNIFGAHAGQTFLSSIQERLEEDGYFKSTMDYGKSW